MNYSRQEGWFDPSKFNTRVSIIGVGATGSFVALQLAKMGVKDIHAYDFDVIEEHNIANQAYGIGDIGLPKVVALNSLLDQLAGVPVTQHNEKVTAEMIKKNPAQFKGIVFILTDNMASRKEIYGALKLNPFVELVIETRMSINCGRVYTINPRDMQKSRKYEETFYDDDVAEVSFCGSSLSIVPTAMNIASYAVWSVIKHHLEKPQTDELLIDLEFNNTIAIDWE